MPKETKTSENVEKRTSRYIKQWKEWREHLKPYWGQIDKNQEMYEFYKSEASETASDVSFNTAFSMVESMIAKGNDSTINVNIKAKGNNGLEEFEEYVSGITKEAIEDPDVATYYGSMRKISEVYRREYHVKGTAFAESEYCYKTGLSTYRGEQVKKVLADNPATRVLPYKSVIFNPSGPADESDIYYIDKFVTFKSLQDREYKEIEEKDEIGTKTKRTVGLYKNLDVLKKKLEEDGKVTDHEEDSFISADTKIRRKVEPVHLIERWEGAKLCVIALTNLNDEEGVTIREEYDPLKIGRHPLTISMRYKIQGRPYAYGDVDAIYKPIRAQDTVLNQSIESVNRYLRPGFMVKDPQADLDAIMTLIESGGVTYGDSEGLGAIQATPPPAQAFQLHELMQQGIERAARYSPYAAGVAGDSTDKTQGTATGITKLQNAAEPNFKTALDDIQDSFWQPIGRMYFKMIGELMGETEIRYALLKGKNPGWVKATKGLMTGKATIGDLVTIGIIKQEELQDPEFLSTLFAELEVTDPSMMLEETPVMDVDWIVEIKLDDQSEADKMEKTQMKMQHIQLGLQTGVPINPEKAWTMIGREMGIEDIDELVFSPEELQQQAMQQQQQMEQQMMAEQEAQAQQMQMEQEGQMQQKQMELQARQQEQQQQAMLAQQQQQAQIEAQLLQEQMRGANQAQVAQMRRPMR